MPYIHGRRVSLEEWQRENGSSLEEFHTGPNGSNPASAPELDPETKAPKSVRKAGSKRSSKGASKVAAAIATATGQDLPDLTGLDAGGEDGESSEGGEE